MSSVRQFVVGLLSDIYRVRPRLNVWQWAKENVYIPRSESAVYGGSKYDPDLTSYTKFMMDCATRPEVREIIVMKSSQVGVTLAFLIVVLYWVAHRIGHIIYALDSSNEMRRLSKARLRPLLEGCAATRSRLPSDPDDVTNLTYYLRGLVIYLLGSYSKGSLENKSVSLAIADEVDSHDQPEGESNTLDLLRQRMKRVIGSKLIAFGKPKTEAHTLNREYRKGSRHKLHLPCPHCGHRQELVLENLRFQHCKDLAGGWDLARVEAETYFECEVCHKPIKEEHKAGMLAAADKLPDYGFVATNHGQDEDKPVPGKISIHISDFYSTFPTASWGIIAREYIESEGDSAKRKDFRNGRQGLPTFEKRTEVKPSLIHGMTGTYDHGHIPIPPTVVLMGADTQDDRSKWVKAGFDYFGNCWVIDYGTTLTLGDLEHIADTPVTVDNWLAVPDADRINPITLAGLVDEGGHRMKDVRDFCQNSNDRFSPCKGRGGVQIVSKDVVEEKSHFIHNGQPLVIYHFNDDAMRCDLYVDRIGRFKEIEKAWNEGGRHAIPRLWFPRQPDPEFVNELCQEQRVQEMRRGRLTWIWQDPKGPNDFGDALKMCFVAWYRLKEFFPPPPPPPPAPAVPALADSTSAEP